jgi:hypothetical protein
MPQLILLLRQQISDALLKLKQPGGGYLPDLEVFSEGKEGTVVGEAYTVNVSSRCSVDRNEADREGEHRWWINEIPRRPSWRVIL